MLKLFLGVPLLMWAAGALTSCQRSEPQAAAPLPESEQVISNSLKDLYMATSAALPQSAEKKKLILRMADNASNGKELLLTMRAAAGVLGSAFGDEIHSTVTVKMMKVATLDQLTDYERSYHVPPASARLYVERMFELGNEQNDPRAWHRIRAAASRLKLSDLEQAALAKAAGPR
jgi:hypothetical protein